MWSRPTWSQVHFELTDLLGHTINLWDFAMDWSFIAVIAKNLSTKKTRKQRGRTSELVARKRANVHGRDNQDCVWRMHSLHVSGSAEKAAHPTVLSPRIRKEEAYEARFLAQGSKVLDKRKTRSLTKLRMKGHRQQCISCTTEGCNPLSTRRDDESLVPNATNFARPGHDLDLTRKGANHK